jgi:hypothetical protein
MVTLMVSNPLLPCLDLSHLRLLSCGGSPQSPTTIQRAIAAFGCEFFVSCVLCCAWLAAFSLSKLPRPRLGLTVCSMPVWLARHLPPTDTR